MTTNAVRSSLSYLVYTGDRPVYVASTGGAAAQLSIDAEFEEHEVAILDARQLEPSASLDLQGFTLLEQHSAITDFYAIESIKADYETELRDLVLGVTGASDVLIFDHTLRSDSSSVRGEYQTREPATVIHNDYTDSSAEKRLRDLLPSNEAEARLRQRFAIVNTWRSVGSPVIRSPLACCDATTIAGADLVASERRAAERIGELELVRWNPDHQWYYYPAMNRDEVLLIKTFDSAKDGRARRSIHSAFENPQAPPDSPPRESIESRCLVFF